MGKWLDLVEQGSAAETVSVELPKAARTTYHGFSLAELEAEADPEEWQDAKDNPEALEAFAHALRTSETRLRGERPDHYTKVVDCAGCGPVWLWEDAPDRVRGCPWCLNRARGLPVPHPGPVVCRDCSHWIPDAVNPAGGLGTCGVGVPGLAWPKRELDCDRYRKAG